MAIPLHKRRKVADFDPVRDGKTITQFCKELGISRQTYINIKNRVAQKGRSGIVPDSTAPKNPARKFDDTDKVAVVNARQHLMEQGLDYGPWSIYYYLFDSIGPERTPSRSTIASWLHELGFVDANARKRPRSSYKRFARDFVGELWQIDGLVYRLFDHAHTQVTIYQIIDDASRFDVGTKAFPLPENGTDARAVLAEAFATYGKPQEILSDNGEAFATYHRGHLSATELWLASEGVLAIAGFAATTQGKDERSHRTLTQFLDVRHPVSLAEVNTYLAEYRHVYNERRRHQSLLVGKMHITPRQAFDTFPKATPPTHPLDPDAIWARVVAYNKAHNPQTAAFAVINGPGEAATSPETNTDDMAAQHDLPPTDTPTLTMPVKQSTNAWGIPNELRVSKDGVARVCNYGLYIGLRFKNRLLYAAVTAENVAEFYTAHDGEFLFSVPLPITLTHRPPGGQININLVKGMKHRQPPRLNPNLSKPRPKRRKP
ncbi:transposase [Corynebacterium sp. CCUG 69979]|nr:integrase core domain-containing protein [Corynebacterium sp. CCUG 70398]MCQ4623946.1 transposase [Corynebacterium sp. CCUG 70398]MCQ4626194.1 transposase [Corynebacterium sp. CCUG 69979]